MKVLFVAGRWAQDIEKSEKLKELRKHAKVDVALSVEEKQLIEKVEDVDVIITGGPITAAVINAAPKLKMIQTTSVGFEYIDEGAAAARGVIICNVAGVNANSVVELDFGMILDIARRIGAHNRLMREGGWARVEVERQVEIRNSTIGIVGLGAIGSRMAQFATQGFNMKVLAYDPYITEARAQQFNARLVDLETLFRESDIVSIHVPLNDETHHMIGEKLLRLMKPTAIFVSSARGPIVDEKALIKVLQEKKISGACLDVYEAEPLPKKSPLRALDNVSLVPHIGSTPGIMVEMRETAVWNVLRVAKGESPLNVQTPKVYYTSHKWSH
ncbi:MAG: hydroxyacid dehydrogenase [Candidatus Bathyarchaeota archaeon]|nr:hydroxyacid dehydrogenase [Candidatus Bathyarchaeota archaeon]